MSVSSFRGNGMEMRERGNGGDSNGLRYSKILHSTKDSIVFILEIQLIIAASLCSSRILLSFIAA